jgi:hypothetical protein
MSRTLVFITLLAAALLCSVQATVWQEIVTIDCNQRVHALGNTPFEFHFDMSTVGSMFNFYADKLKSRMKSCKCPNMSDRWFMRNMVPSIEMGIYALSPQVSSDNSCSTPQSLLASVKSSLNTRFNFPSTCTLDDVSAGRPCNLQFSVASADITIRISIDPSCSSTSGVPNLLPYISVTCTGNGCANLGKPCSADSDCKSTNYFCYNPANMQFSHHLMSKFADFIGIGKSSGGSCTDLKSMYTSFADILHKTYFGGSIPNWSAPNSANFCVPKNLFQLDLSDIGVSGSRRATPNIEITNQEAAPVAIPASVTSFIKSMPNKIASVLPQVRSTSQSSQLYCNGLPSSQSCSGAGSCSLQQMYMDPSQAVCNCYATYNYTTYTYAQKIGGAQCNVHATCSASCQNGGTCVMSGDDSTGQCSCLNGYYGPQCQYVVKCGGIRFDASNVCGYTYKNSACYAAWTTQLATTEVSNSGACSYCGNGKSGRNCDATLPSAGQTISVSALSAWTGTLDDGTAVNSDSRKSGGFFSNNNFASKIQVNSQYVTLLKTYCNGEFGLLPESIAGLRGSAPQLRTILQSLNSALTKARSCDSTFSNNLNRVLTQLWQPDPWLYFNTITSTSFSISPYLYGSAQMLMKLIGLNKRQLIMPSTCNFDTWQNTGKCTATYTGLSTLLGSSVNLHLRIERCLNPYVTEGLPLIEITCEGQACQNVLSLKPCSSDSDCNGITGSCIDPLAIAGQQQSPYDAWDIYYLGFSSSDICKASRIQTVTDYWNMLKFSQGNSVSSVGSTSSAKICALNYNSITSSSAQTWLQNAVTVTADQIVVNGLNSFTGPAILNAKGNSADAVNYADPTSVTESPTTNASASVTVGYVTLIVAAIAALAL